jgi:hypothetical protein
MSQGTTTKPPILTDPDWQSKNLYSNLNIVDFPVHISINNALCQNISPLNKFEGNLLRGTCSGNETMN